MFFDSWSAIHLARNEVNHSRRKTYGCSVPLYLRNCSTGQNDHAEDRHERQSILHEDESGLLGQVQTLFKFDQYLASRLSAHEGWALVIKNGIFVIGMNKNFAKVENI